MREAGLWLVRGRRRLRRGAARWQQARTAAVVVLVCKGVPCSECSCLWHTGLGVLQAVASGTLTGHKHPHSAITQKETGERAPEVLVVKEQLPVCELESGLCESLMSGCFMQLILVPGRWVLWAGPKPDC